MALPGLVPGPAVTGSVRLEASRRARAGICGWVSIVGPGRARRDSRWASAAMAPALVRPEGGGGGGVEEAAPEGGQPELTRGS